MPARVAAVPPNRSDMNVQNANRAPALAVLSAASRALFSTSPARFCASTLLAPAPPDPDPARAAQAQPRQRDDRGAPHPRRRPPATTARPPSQRPPREEAGKTAVTEDGQRPGTGQNDELTAVSRYTL